jgi:hypothetical protein
MALKYKFQTREEIPAEHAALYVERDGAFFLDAEGVTDKAKADELRDNNIALKKQIEESLRTATEERQQLQQLQSEKERLELIAQGHKPEEIEKLVTERLKVIKADLDKQLLAKSTELEVANTRLTTIQIDQGVITVATKRGLRPTALPDITSRARTVFKLVNGAPHAFEADGKTVRYGRDGISPMTLEEWVDAQVSEAPHLFESNAGGGAASNGAGGAAGVNRSVKNPFRKDTWNLTEQMKLQKSDPGLAARLKAAA